MRIGKKVFIIMSLVFGLICVLSGQVVNLGEIQEVKNPEMIATDGQSLFILDGLFVYEFDFKGLTFKNKFGREGSGPGEFKVDHINRLRMRLVDKEIMLSNFSKIAYFTKSGKFIREIRLPFVASQITPVGENLVITRFMNGENGENKMGVVLYTGELKKIKLLYTKPEISVRRSGRLDAPNEMIFVNFNRHIFIADQKLFRVHILNPQGERIKEISLDRAPVKLSEQYKKEVLDWFEAGWSGRFKSFAERMNIDKGTMKKMIHFHEYFPAFRSLSLIDDGICFETYIKKGNQSKFVLLDFEGNVKKEVFLTDAEPGRIKMMANFTYLIWGGHYYYLQENLENESWELIKEVI